MSVAIQPGTASRERIDRVVDGWGHSVPGWYVAHI